MWAMTKNLAQEMRAQRHPAAKVGFGVLTAVVTLCTASWVALKLLGNVTLGVLKIANDGLYSALQHAQAGLRQQRDDPAGEWVSQPLSKDLPDGMPSYFYTGNDPRWLDRYHEDEDDGI